MDRAWIIKIMSQTEKDRDDERNVKVSSNHEEEDVSPSQDLKRNLHTAYSDCNESEVESKKKKKNTENERETSFTDDAADSVSNL